MQILHLSLIIAHIYAYRVCLYVCMCMIVCDIDIYSAVDTMMIHCFCIYRVLFKLFKLHFFLKIKQKGISIFIVSSS